MHPEAHEKAVANSANSSDELKMETASNSEIDNDPIYSYQEQRSIIHRVDRRLVVTCGLLYCFSLIDRGNLGAASIAGLVSSLQPVGITIKSISRSDQYSVPRMTDDLMLDVGFRYCFGFVQSWTDMLALRIILGVFEAGIYPSIAYLLATWYSRYDVGKRFSSFYILGCIANAFAGILAYGLMQMDGLGGEAGWRWIFIMEGIMTCVVALLAYFSLVDFPEKADRSWRFLNKNERDFIIRRITKDRDDAIPEPFTFKRFFTPALDLKIWMFALASL
ncbi:MAG: hypothetical protein Q9188_004703 [Gyalolechia gomerana]